MSGHPDTLHDPKVVQYRGKVERVCGMRFRKVNIYTLTKLNYWFLCVCSLPMHLQSNSNLCKITEQPHVQLSFIEKRAGNMNNEMLHFHMVMKFRQL